MEGVVFIKNEVKQEQTFPKILVLTHGFFGSELIKSAELVIGKMEDSLPFEEASYLEPLATAVHGIRKMNVQPDDTMLVIGAGNMGMLNAQVARAFGCRVFISEVNENRIRYDILVCEEFSCLEFHTDRDTINWILKIEYRRSSHGKTTQKNHGERHRLCSRR